MSRQAWGQEYPSCMLSQRGGRACPYHKEKPRRMQAARPPPPGAAAQRPEGSAGTKGLSSISAAMVVLGPWPGSTAVSPGRA